MPLIADPVEDLDISTLSIGSRRVLRWRLHLKLVQAFIDIDAARASVKST